MDISTVTITVLHSDETVVRRTVRGSGRVAAIQIRSGNPRSRTEESGKVQWLRKQKDFDWVRGG